MPYSAQRRWVETTPMTQMTEIAISQIIPNPTQPRTQFDEEALKELSDSIKQLGIIQPITVKKQDEKYIIIRVSVAGEHHSWLVSLPCLHTSARWMTRISTQWLWWRTSSVRISTP